jgi:hypothetical protein
MERAALVKFGNLEHLESLQTNGEVYMNTLPYFRKIEDDDLRGDPFDSVSEIQRGTKGTITHPETGATFPVTEFTLRLGPNEPEKINLFCMYALRPEHGTFPVPEDNFRFGNHALVITNVPVFLDKISIYLREHKITGKADLVEYLDNNHVGDVGPFKKLKKFSYQSEWRLMCKNGSGTPIKLKIGSLKNISILIESSKINHEVKIYPKSC